MSKCVFYYTTFCGWVNVFSITLRFVGEEMCFLLHYTLSVSKCAFDHTTFYWWISCVFYYITLWWWVNVVFITLHITDEYFVFFITLHFPVSKCVFYCTTLCWWVNAFYYTSCYRWIHVFLLHNTVPDQIVWILTFSYLVCRNYLFFTRHICI